MFPRRNWEKKQLYYQDIDFRHYLKRKSRKETPINIRKSGFERPITLKISFNGTIL